MSVLYFSEFSPAEPIFTSQHEEDGFYYDHIHVKGDSFPLRLRTLVGLIPLLAVDILDDELLQQLPHFRQRMEWFRKYSSLGAQIQSKTRNGKTLFLLGLPSQDQLQRIVRYLLDENEFLSPYGIRSLSKHYEANPFHISIAGQDFSVKYLPGESDSHMFGGNSSWRGSLWFPTGSLIIDALETWSYFYDDEFLVEFPTGSSGPKITLKQVADQLRVLFLSHTCPSVVSYFSAQRRFVSIFMPNPTWHPSGVR